MLRIGALCHFVFGMSAGLVALTDDEASPYPARRIRCDELGDHISGAASEMKLCQEQLLDRITDGASR